MIKHQTPHSSNVAEFGYDEDSGELHVMFKSKDGTAGKRYVYSGVEPEHYEAMKASDSVGSYIHTHIKGSYNHRPV